MKTKQYEANYRPKICYVNCSFYYYNLKDQVKIERAMSKEMKKKFYKRINVKGMVLVLDENNKIPTNKMKENASSRIWYLQNIKGKIADHKTSIVDIKIISNHGRVSYAFDESKH